MALRFLADHCISNTIIQTLRGATHEVVRLRDVLPVESPDTIVIAKAQEMDAILLSMNGDFADIVTYPPNNYKGIVALQMRSWSKSTAFAFVSRNDPGDAPPAFERSCPNIESCLKTGDRIIEIR